MKSLECLGAAGEVTGSAHLLTSTNDGMVLIDFGMFQEAEDGNIRNDEKLAFDPKKLDGVIITHAHLDHSGRLPLLTKYGYKGKIYMTEPTAALVSLILNDSALVAQKRGETPIYTPKDIAETLKQIKVMRYNQNFDVGSFTVTLKNAGHILGSASVEMKEKGSREGQTIVFSGDLGNDSSDIVGPATRIKKADIVVIESTYGDKNHQEDDPMEVIRYEINRIERAKRGTLLIPAFSIHRTQYLLLIIQELKKTKQIDKMTPVFLDSPMGIRATDIYKRFWNNYFVSDEYIDQFDNPFDFKGLVPTLGYKSSQEIGYKKGPKIIIASSGMMNGGRVRQHALKYLPDDYSRILFVGYQADETVGKEIAEGAKEVLIDKQWVDVRANVSVTDSLSSHRGQDQLLDWLAHPDKVRRVLLVHGGSPQREILASKIEENLGIYDIVLPKRCEQISL